MMTSLAITEPSAGFSLNDARTGEACRLALQELWLTGHILPVGARLMVRHTFRSAEKKPLEMIYAFALPRDASLHRFRVTGKGYSIRSELLPVAEAQQQYEEGIDRGSLSTMARIYGDGLVNLNVGNIAPGETVTVWLELAAGVESHDDGYRFRFPFTLAPSYHRQARATQNEEGQCEMELPEETFGDLVLPVWERDGKDLHRVGFHLDIEMPGAIGEISSPSHPLRLRMGEAGHARVLLGNEGDLPDRDLVLDVSEKGRNGASVFGGLDDEGKARVAALIPSGEFGERQAGARRIVFLLDRSGSMSGAPIEQARRALAACLPLLEPADAFAIVAFDHEVETFRDGLSDGSSGHRQAARDFLNHIDARGGTELLAGIQAGARLLGGKGGEILLMTDGEVFETESIVQVARQAGVRLHCLGIGDASQDRFLAQLARETGGVSRFMTPRERVDMAALELFGSLGRPVAEGVRFELEDLPGGRIEPQPVEAVYSGTPVTVFARADAAGQGRLVAKWESKGEEQRREFPVTVEGRRIGQTLKLLQGARLITDSQLESGPESRADGKLAKRKHEREQRRLEQLSREYGLASRAMSLVAVLERAADQPGQLPDTHVVPVGMPGGTQFEAYFHKPQIMYSLAPNVSASGAISANMGQVPDAAMESEPVMFRRRGLFGRKMPSRPPESTPEDTLMDLAGLLEPDGGMPGKDLQERVVCTAAALLCFIGRDVSAGDGPFSRHMAKMIKFLEVINSNDMDDDLDQVRQRILEAALNGQPIPGDWLKLARRLIIDRKMSAGKALKEMGRQLEKTPRRGSL